MVTNVGDTLPTVDQLLDNARKAAEAKRSGKTTGLSAVEKLLAGRENPEDTVQLSPVAKVLQQREKDKPDQTPYTEQDWYIKQKVEQLRAQLALYSNLPGLDPGGNIMAGIESEIKAMAGKQAKQFADLEAKAKEARNKQAEQDRLKAQEGPSPDELLKRASNRVSGTTTPTELSPEAKALLDKAAATVNKTA